MISHELKQIQSCSCACKKGMKKAVRYGYSCEPRCLSLHRKPGINYLLTFATLPPTQLLNIILKHFHSALATNF